MKLHNEKMNTSTGCSTGDPIMSDGSNPYGPFEHFAGTPPDKYIIFNPLFRHTV
jgi:hypothetical protein